MAVYEGARYLPTQIDSILPQLGPEDELIISYDKSRDNTREVLKEYEEKDSRVKVFDNNHPGITGNFNNAISHCTGDYIYISDQDDRWADNKVAVVQRLFETTGADMVIHNGIHTDENLNPKGVPFFEMFRIGDGLLKNFIKPRMSGCCIIFTRRLQSVILPIPEIRAYDHWIAMVGELWGKIAYCDDVLLYHRMHGTNVTPQKRRALLLILKMRSRLAFFLVRRAFRELLRKRK